MTPTTKTPEQLSNSVILGTQNFKMKRVSTADSRKYLFIFLPLHSIILSLSRFLISRPPSGIKFSTTKKIILLESFFSVVFLEIKNLKPREILSRRWRKVRRCRTCFEFWFLLRFLNQLIVTFSLAWIITTLQGVCLC